MCKALIDQLKENLVALHGNGTVRAQRAADPAPEGLRDISDANDGTHQRSYRGQK